MQNSENKSSIPHRLQTLFGTSIRVIKHRVSSPQHHVHTLTHRHRLQHLHHLFVRATQHTVVIDVDQDVRWRTKDQETQSVDRLLNHNPTGSVVWVLFTIEGKTELEVNSQTAVVSAVMQRCTKLRWF